ncbi:cytochrome c biogenesis protein ResB [Streptomyces sp. NPDC059506]|uniref:cytochrome c biogenesis protein ResB n=1 Tax=unclassified Streptomyces TaxID=2593676 RepID=UPI0015FDF5E1|nr:cytochrome c biogenesis protein ResB [Streptomyces sp. SCUT-3]QMV22775.1 cytochrome c biogenesis protein ResB [Streptomyces sp. SCUT-3]
MSTTKTDAAEVMSSAPADDTGTGEGPGGPQLGPVGWLRWLWRQLTSMRVALVLLFLLSLAAVPGSLVPQEGSDPVKVQDFVDRHETLGPLYEKIGMFHVYSSTWFSAVYILLFVSLIGCIVPRTWQFVGVLRARPPAAPRRLERMPAHARWSTDAPADEVLAAARRILGRRRFRTGASDGSVAAEKGYLREAGNLVFHIALIVMLVGFAAGQLYMSEGTKLVVEGDGFANNLTQYDDFKDGNLFDRDDLGGFGFTLDEFTGTYERSGPQRGSARDFRADITYWEAGGEEKKAVVSSNHPLEVAGYKAYLTGHGYAPVVTVRDGQGDVAYRGPAPFLPMDGNVTSQGVVKVTDYVGKDGERDQLGFSGIFVPTFEGASATRGMVSAFPALDNPVLFLTAYRGDLGVDSGIAQNVYQLDNERMEQFTDADGTPLAQMMKPGDTMELPDGAGSLTFERIDEWATFQVTSKPGTDLALAGAIAAIAGLSGSLFIQRRRVWVRATPDGHGRTVVETAALGRSESARVAEELGDIAALLHNEAPAVPEQQPEQRPDTDPDTDKERA